MDYRGLKREEALENRSLIVELGPEKFDEEGKKVGQYAEIQVDQSRMNPDKIRTGEKKAQTNPYLASKKVEGVNPKTKEHYEYTNHQRFYQASQIDAMVKAAGKKSVQVKDVNGKDHTVLGITANLVNTKDHSLVVDTSKPMAPTKNPYFGKNVLDKQKAVTEAARDFADAQRNAQKNAPTADKEVVAQAEAQAEQPEV